MEYTAYEHPSVNNPLSQQENARMHTAKLVLSFFEQYTVTLESHAAYSPNLNPIEHARVLLKRQVHTDYTWIGDCPGGPQKMKEGWAGILPLCWEKTPPKQFETL